MLSVGIIAHKLLYIHSKSRIKFINTLLDDKKDVIERNG